MGHIPSTAGTFRKKFRKNSGKTPETLSERFLGFPSRVRLGCPKPYNSRHLRRPERFQNSLPPSTAGDASFFRIGSGEGLSELVMEFPAVLGVFLSNTFMRNAAESLEETAQHPTENRVQKSEPFLCYGLFWAEMRTHQQAIPRSLPSLTIAMSVLKENAPMLIVHSMAQQCGESTGNPSQWD